MRLRFVTPAWGFAPAFVMALVCALVVPASAQPKGKGKGTTPVAGPSLTPTPVDPSKPDADKDNKKPGKQGPTKTYDFNALDLNGRMRTPQLLYFLERANEELERASLEKRSFIPHMVRSLEEEAL